MVRFLIVCGMLCIALFMYGASQNIASSKSQNIASSKTQNIAGTKALGITISGPARVVDGDTIVVDKVKIRLWGIDAPEWAQECKNRANKSFYCGQVATYQLSGEIADQNVTCVVRAYDRYKRAVATCSTPTTDLQRFMVQRGYAQDYTHYSRGAYKSEENDARLNKRGFWDGKFRQPWDYRHDLKASRAHKKNVRLDRQSYN